MYFVPSPLFVYKMIPLQENEDFEDKECHV